MKVLPGNTGPDKAFVKSAKGDCVGIKVEYTVIGGDHAGRSFRVWHLVDGTTQGHKEARDYTLAKLRAIVDAVHSLNPRDTSPEVQEIRIANADLACFNGATFLAELGVEAGGPKPRGGSYDDKNTVARVLRLGDDGYSKLEQPALTPIQNPPSVSANGSGNSASHGAPAEGSASPVAAPGWANR